MILRPYQIEAYNRTMEEFKTHQSVLGVLFTGGGKTVIFSHIAKEFMKTGRVMLLAHREELIDQGLNKMEAVTGVRGDIEMGRNFAARGYFKNEIVVSSIQTQNAGKEYMRMMDFFPNDFSLIIVDEAHRSISETYLRAIDHYKKNPNIKILGVTATPNRHDKKAMGRVYESVAFNYDILYGVTEGWLVPIQQEMCYVTGYDLSGVSADSVDLTQSELAEVLEFEKVLHGFAKPLITEHKDKKSLIFTVSVAQAERLAWIINRNLPGQARYVCGKTPKDERRRIFSEFAERKFLKLVNVGIATEGFDDPDIELIAMARPSLSRSLVLQMMGRGLRPASDIAYTLNDVADAAARISMILNSVKKKVTVVDYVGNCGKHKLVTSADVLAGSYSDEVVKLAKQAMEKSGKPEDVLTELQKAEQEVNKNAKRKAEAFRLDRLKIDADYISRIVNPFDRLDLLPDRKIDMNTKMPATIGQVKALKDMGVDTKKSEGYMTSDEAGRLLDNLMDREKKGFCSYKQGLFLRKYHIAPENITKAQAKSIFLAIKNNNWRVPSDVRSKYTKK